MQNSTHPNLIHIRKATQVDAGKLAPMLSFIENKEISQPDIAARISKAAPFETPFVAEINGLVIGFAFLRVVPNLSTESPYTEITELYVEDLTQRETVGRALVKEAEAAAREKGAQHLFLLTGMRNTSAKTLYRAMGFREYALALRKRLK